MSYRGIAIVVLTAALGLAAVTATLWTLGLPALRDRLVWMRLLAPLALTAGCWRCLQLSS
jgi:hypothetical protein